MNVDGAQIYKSAKSTFLPILVKKNYLSPNMRFKINNMLIVGLYYGKRKPDIEKILFPLSN